MIESSVLKEVIIKMILGLANSPVLIVMLLVVLFALLVFTLFSD